MDRKKPNPVRGIRISPEMYKEVMKLAYQENRTFSGMILILLSEAIRERKSRDKN